MIASLDRLGRSTQNMLTFAGALRARGVGLRILNLAGGDVDTLPPYGIDGVHRYGCVGTDEYEIKRERVTDSIDKRCAAGKDLDGRPTGQARAR